MYATIILTKAGRTHGGGDMCICTDLYTCMYICICMYVCT